MNEFMYIIRIVCLWLKLEKVVSTLRHIWAITRACLAVGSQVLYYLCVILVMNAWEQSSV